MKPNQSHQSGVSRRAVLKQGALVSGIGLTGVSVASGTAVAKKGDIVVPKDYDTIQAAVDDAEDGDTITIQPGTYDENVTVDKKVTLRGRNAPQSSNPAHLDGQIEITTDGDGSAIRCLQISPSETFEGGTFPHPAGVLVKASDVVVENNVIEDFNADLSNGEGSFTLHGVQIFRAEEGDVSDVTVQNNVIRGFTSEGNIDEGWSNVGGIAAVKAQAGVEDVTIKENEIYDHHSAGWVWGVVLTASGSADGIPKDVTVKKNHITDLNDGSKYDVFEGVNDGRGFPPYPGSAFGIDGGANADEATVKNNNLLAPNGAESKDPDNTLVAKCNWWGDKSGPKHEDNEDGNGMWALERNDSTIEYAPWLNAPAPSNACIGGKNKDKGKSGKGK